MFADKQPPRRFPTKRHPERGTVPTVSTGRAEGPSPTGTAPGAVGAMGDRPFGGGHRPRGLSCPMAWRRVATLHSAMALCKSSSWPTWWSRRPEWTPSRPRFQGPAPVRGRATHIGSTADRFQAPPTPNLHNKRMRIWMLNLPDTKVCSLLLTARYGESQSKQEVNHRHVTAWFRFWAGAS